MYRFRRMEQYSRQNMHRYWVLQCITFNLTVRSEPQTFTGFVYSREFSLIIGDIFIFMIYDYFLSSLWHVFFFLFLSYNLWFQTLFNIIFKTLIFCWLKKHMTHIIFMLYVIEQLQFILLPFIIWLRRTQFFQVMPKIIYTTIWKQNWSP